MFFEWLQAKKKGIIIAIIVAIAAAVGLPQAAVEVVASSVYDKIQQKSVEKPLVTTPVQSEEIKK